jgi:hypothetical protein
VENNFLKYEEQIFPNKGTLLYTYKQDMEQKTSRNLFYMEIIYGIRDTNREQNFSAHEKITTTMGTRIRPHNKSR